MSIHLEIPDSISQAIRLPTLSLKRQFMLELSVTLYARGILSFGKARELAKLGKHEFGLLLGQRQIPRHYSEEELRDDLKYAHQWLTAAG